MSSILKVDQLQDSGGNNLVTSNGSGVITAAGFGKVGQVVSTSKTDTFTSTSTGSFIDITGLSLSITPSSTSSKILILFSVQGGSSASNYANLRLVRDSTAIGVGDSASSRLQSTTGFRITVTASQNTFSNQFLDSPSSTSALTYKLQVYNNTSGTITVNRSSADTDSASQGRNISTITAMEILP